MAITTTETECFTELKGDFTLPDVQPLIGRDACLYFGGGYIVGKLESYINDGNHFRVRAMCDGKNFGSVHFTCRQINRILVAHDEIEIWFH